MDRTNLPSTGDVLVQLTRDTCAPLHRQIEAAARRGVALYGLAPYRLAAKGSAGLLFGYATLDESTVRDGVKILAEVVNSQ